MGKSKKRTVPYAREHAPLARAMTAGPALLEAVRPVAARIRANPLYRYVEDGRLTGEVVSVFVTEAEARAILAAVDRATWEGGK